MALIEHYSIGTAANIWDQIEAILEGRRSQEDILLMVNDMLYDIENGRKTVHHCRSVIHDLLEEFE